MYGALTICTYMHQISQPRLESMREIMKINAIPLFQGKPFVSMEIDGQIFDFHDFLDFPAWL